MISVHVNQITHNHAKPFEKQDVHAYVHFNAEYIFQPYKDHLVIICPYVCTGGNVTIEIVMLAMVAAFLGFRLFAVLGKRTGHEQEPLVRQPLEERTAPVIRPPVANGDAPAGGTLPQSNQIDPSAENGLRAIINADRQFDAQLFIEGSKSAYRMVLEAFWNADKNTLRYLCDDDVYDSFVAAIDGREARGEVFANQLIRIEDARIIEAHIDHPVARVTVRFDADIASVVKDADGNLIGGSLTDAVEIHDIWTFMRDVKGNDRNWKLDETDQA